jgi:hypothetical protein
MFVSFRLVRVGVGLHISFHRTCYICDTAHSVTLVIIISHPLPLDMNLMLIKMPNHYRIGRIVQNFTPSRFSYVTCDMSLH